MDKAQECRVLTQTRERMMEIEALNEELIWLGDYVIPTYERERAFKKKIIYDKPRHLGEYSRWNQETETVLTLIMWAHNYHFKSILEKLPSVHLFISYLYELLSYFLLLLLQVLRSTFSPFYVSGKMEGKRRHQNEWCAQISYERTQILVLILTPA